MQKEIGSEGVGTKEIIGPTEKTETRKLYKLHTHIHTHTHTHKHTHIHTHKHTHTNTHTNRYMQMDSLFCFSK